MSHYEKLAIVALRILGCVVASYALIVFGYVLSFIGSVGSSLASALTYLIVGAVLFALSKPIAAFVVKGLPVV